MKFDLSKNSHKGKNEINLSDLHKTNDEYQAMAFDIIYSTDKLLELINAFKITRQEVLDNMIDFIGIKESIDKPDVYPYEYKVKRNLKGKLIVKKKFAHNDYKSTVRRKTNLWLTDVTPINEKVTLKNFKESSLSRKNILSIANELAKAINKNTAQDLKSLYFFTKKSVGKTYLCHALANYFAGEDISTVFVKTPHLYQYFVSIINSNNEEHSYNEVMNILLNAKMLIIDDLGEEKSNLWFRKDVLFRIIRERYEKNKKIIFSSQLPLKFLESLYKKNIPIEEKFKIEKLAELIKNNSRIIELD